jgi:hypothetical protein
MAEHRINPPIPSHLLPQVNPDGSLTVVPEQHEALCQFMAELHVTDFQIPRSPFGRLPHSTTGPDYKTIPPDQREKAVRYYRDYYQYVKANGWAERAYIYLLDEPNTPENYEQVRVLAEVVREASPELKCLVVEQTYPHDPSWPDIDRRSTSGARCGRSSTARRSAETGRRRFRLVVHRAGPARAPVSPAVRGSPRQGSALLAHRPAAAGLPRAHLDQPAIRHHRPAVLEHGHSGDRAVVQPGVCSSAALQRRRIPVLPRRAVRDRRSRSPACV